MATAVGGELLPVIRFNNFRHAALASLYLGLSFTWLPYPLVVLPSEIREFHPAGKMLKSWGVGAYVFPHGLSVDAQGSVWVSDAQGRGGKGHQVFKYDANGALLMTIGVAGAAGDGSDGKLTEPTDVIAAPNGDIFITEGHAIGGRRRPARCGPTSGAFDRSVPQGFAGPRRYRGRRFVPVRA